MLVPLNHLYSKSGFAVLAFPTRRFYLQCSFAERSLWKGGFKTEVQHPGYWNAVGGLMRTGQGLREHLQRRMPIVRSARPVVEAVGDGLEFVLAVDRQVGALGQVLTKQAIFVLEGAALPWAMGVAEVHPSAGCLRPGRRVVTFTCLGRRSPSAGRRLRVSLRSPCRWVTA